MAGLVKTNTEEAIQTLEYLEKEKLMQNLDIVVGDVTTNLKRLVDLHDRCKRNKSAQALDVELKIIQYIDQLRGIKPQGKEKSINIAVFTYDQNSSKFKH